MGIPTTNGASKEMVFTPEGVCLRGKNELVDKRVCGSEKNTGEREKGGENRKGKGKSVEGIDGWEIRNENISTRSSRHSFCMTTVLSIPTPTRHHGICLLPQKHTYVTLDTLYTYIPTQYLPCMLLGFWFP